MALGEQVGGYVQGTKSTKDDSYMLKFSHGMSATGAKYWDIISSCLDIPESLTYCLTC